MNGTGRGPDTPDFLVVGGGIIGLALAREARRRHPGARVLLVEKEDACGLHASGRNSGVLHAGFYYTADSLKARFSVDGNRRLAAYCEERGLRIDRCGKLVVARDESELAGLDELARRGRINGVELEVVDEAEARELEPEARTHGRALFSPSTAVVDPAEVVAAVVEDAVREGVEVRTACPYLGRDGDRVRLGDGEVSPGYLINAAGLYADRIAREHGFSERYRILPFKGLYLYAAGGGPRLRRHIYPVPELAYPFLGVHFTVTAHGRTKIGPTAIPSFWREHYRGLDNFDLGELAEVVGLEALLFLRNEFGFRRLAVRESRKYSKSHLLGLASGLVRGSLSDATWTWGKPGIRAQLMDVRENRLEMDFRYEGDERSFHVLNAVSPAFTCSFPFAEFLFDRIEEAIGTGSGSGVEAGEPAGAGSGR